MPSTIPKPCLVVEKNLILKSVPCNCLVSSILCRDTLWKPILLSKIASGNSTLCIYTHTQELYVHNTYVIDIVHTLYLFCICTYVHIY